MSLVSLHGGHTTVFDGAAGPAEMIEAAAARGMEVFGLSDHFYRPRDERLLLGEWDRDKDWGRALWPWYVEEVLRAREALGAGPRVLLGAEVDYLRGHEEWTRAELARWPLDFVVVSVHFVSKGEQVFSFDLGPDQWRRAAEAHGGPVGLFRAYYDHVLEALEWRVGDVLGHLDVVKVFAPAAVSDPGVDARLDRILGRCAELGVVLDLNARGLLKPCREVYPSVPLLERALRAGLEIVPGDDSHSPEQVGLNLEAALEHARQAGYRRIGLPARLGGQSWPI